MKVFAIAAAALVATTGAASAQFEGTFGSNGNFGFNGTTGFSDCFSGGQGNGGTGSTTCDAGSRGDYSFSFNERIHGGYQEGSTFQSETNTSTTNGILSQWTKTEGNKQGTNLVGNVTNTGTTTLTQGGFSIDGSIDRNTSTSFKGWGYANTTSNFSGGTMQMRCMFNCND